MNGLEDPQGGSLICGRHVILYGNLKPALRLLSRLLLFCCLLAAAPTGRSAQPKGPVVLLEEDFEGYADLPSLKTFWGDGSGLLLTNAPGGGRALLHRGGKFNNHGGLKRAKVDATHKLVLSADFYDFATNSERRVSVSLTNKDGDFLAIGCVGSHPYAIRASFLPGETNWIPFRHGMVPTPGWHHMEAILSTTNLIATLDLGAKGKIDRQVAIPITNTPAALPELRIGSLIPSTKWRTPILVDNIKVELVPARARVAAAPPRKQQPPPSAEPVAGLIPPEKLLATTEANAASPSNASAVIARELELASAQLATAASQSPTQPTASGSRDSTDSINSAIANVSNSTGNALWWILGALAAIFVLLMYLLMVLRGGAWSNAAAIQASLPAPAQALATRPQLSIGPRPALNEGDAEWKKRALEAEALAAKQSKILHEKVGPELVEFAKETLVQGLYTQRSALIETQQRAQQALLDLEQRLAELDLPIQERIQAYENRITELEKELESRNDEMRELTRATLILIRKKVEEARAEGTEPRLN